MKCLSAVIIGFLILQPLMAKTATGLMATEIRGTVIDPQDAVVVSATVSLTDVKSGAVKTTLTDGKGSFTFTDLQPGSYRLRVNAAGFRTVVRQDLQVSSGRQHTLEIKLEVAVPIERIDVVGEPGTDPVYAQLRDVKFSGESADIRDLELVRDVGRFQLQEGTMYFLAPVMDRVTGAVFIGRGRFFMRPPVQQERDHLRHFLDDVEDTTQVVESFGQLILRFTDKTYEELKAKATFTGRPVPDSVTGVFDDHQKELRRELRVTIELRILADLYSPTRSSQDGTYPGIFNAFIKGERHKKLIFVNDPLSALPDLLSPEEVALVSYDRGTAGVWSMFHYLNEYVDGTASSDEEYFEYDITHHRIEAVIDRGEQLTATAQLTFTPRLPGLRVLQFALYPRLRISRVLGDDGTPLPFIQADYDEGGAMAVIMPEPLSETAHILTFEYRGPEAIQDSGGGNYLLNPGARATWYPNNWLFTFGDRATFDVTYRVPKNLLMIGNGTRVRQWTEDKYDASQWISEFPLAVAGFNYGDFRVLEKKDRGFDINVFTNKDDPDEIKRIRQAYEEIERSGQSGIGLGAGGGGITVNLPIGNLSTSSLANSAVVEAINSIRIFNEYFGVNPYGRIVMSQQPVFYFGQSWPMLVYMPYIAFLDSTQRRVLGFGAQISKFTDVVGPHEIAHQWWGHLVSWKTYRDQWLSEGFAEFSASLYVQYAYDKDAQKRHDRFLKFWDDVRKRVTEKVPLGAKGASLRPNDVGPLWMGQRLDNSRTGGAYNYLIYSKGAFVLHMLRMMMYDTRADVGHQDERFIAMMRDFVKTHLHHGASTEDFKRVVEKHMTPEMDQEGNGRMDWFFNQWVYGTDLPHYRLEYGLSSASGKPVLNVSLTQSNVSDAFVMSVPIYIEFGKGKSTRLSARITGNNTVSAELPLPEKPKSVSICSNYDVLATIEEVKLK